MNEEFLQYVWANSLFRESVCFSTGKKQIRILHVGTQNLDSGPDFFCARIEVDGIVLVGNVEIHQRGSDWYHHRHHEDPAYDNVILSIVEVADKDIYSSKGIKIESVILGFDKGLWDEYVYMRGIPLIPRCHRHLKYIGRYGKEIILSGYAVERLERKCHEIKEMLTRNRNDWEECFYRLLLKYWSGNVNADAFSLLAEYLPYKKILRCGDSLFKIEALLFGSSGFLEEEFESDEYRSSLQREYEYQSAKFELARMEIFQWRFMRVRPINFPSVRLALLAGMMYRFQSLFSVFLEIHSLPKAKELFDAKTSVYWNTHYRFNVVSPYRVKKIGEAMKDVILINAVIPLLFVYGKERGEEHYCEKALRWLDGLKAEKNRITRQWQRYGLTIQTALQSQALLQIRREYCEKHRCLQCKIAREVFRGLKETESV